MNTPLKIAIEFDDFSPRNSNLALLEEIKEHYPNFQVTLFTVPWEIRFGQPTPITDAQFRPWVEAVKANADWIEIALHGLTHKEQSPQYGVPAEFENIAYDEAWKRITVGEKMFINRDIPLAKIFKAPQWQLSSEGKKAAEVCGFKVVEDGYYHWNLKDDFPFTDKVPEIVIAHGHVQNVCGNGIEESMHRIMQLPTDTQFLKLSQAI